MRHNALAPCCGLPLHATMLIATAFLPASPAGAVAPPIPQARLEINEIGMYVGNNAVFGLNQSTYDAGLEFPRGSDRFVLYTAGLQVSGRVAGERRIVVAEFGSEWGPGSIVAGQPSGDPSEQRVFRVTRGDTAGRGAWDGLAVPLGAPATPPGDQTLWTVCNDLALPVLPPRGSLRLTPPIGLETQITAWAFDRPGVLQRALFMHLRLVHEGAAPLDSAAVGIFFDPRAAPYALRAAADTARDMAYAYPADDPAGESAVAVGIVWLGGPGNGAGPRMRPTSFVVYPNGSDPADAVQFDRALRGALPWGAAMIDSSTGQPTPWFSPGDPVGGSGWVATVPAHPHAVLAAQPFTLAPGDTQDVELAIVIGRGADRTAAILNLRAAADEARAFYAAGFAGLPAPAPEALPGRILAFPNPAQAGARLVFRVASSMEHVEAVLYDVHGRRVRRLTDAVWPAGRQVVEWDGRDDEGRHVGAGLYFVRMTIGGREYTARIVRLSGG